MGVRFIAITDHYDSATGSDDADQIIVPFKNLINDAYCRDISIKIRSQLDVKRKNGQFIGNFAAYGYLKDPEDKNHLIVDEYAADIVRLIFNLKIDGYSSQRIAARLNEMGVLPPLEYKRSRGMNYNSGFRSGSDPKWAVTSINRILQNELYIGTMVQGKNRKINYKVKKSSPIARENWIRVENTHEAIIPEESFQYVQSLLEIDTRIAPKRKSVYLFSGFVRCGDCGENMVKRSTTKKGKKYCYYHCSTYKNKEGFPNLKVVDGGALKGFVSVNRSWTGFTVEDYKKASQSVYSDQSSIQDIEESKEEKKDGGFDLSGYEIVRAQFFSTRLNPAMTISEGRITFNTACLKKFEDVEYVEILFNSIERCIAVRPCDKDNINAVKWGTIRNGKWAVLPKSCRGFSEPLFELMDWNNECKYRFRGQYSKEDNEQILLFDLEEPEVIKHEIIQEDLPDTDTTETEENTVDTSKNKTKKIVRTLFPKQWQNHFGDSSEDVLLLHRVKYYGNWDVLRPAKIVEGLEPISENLLDKLNEEAQNMIEKMRCAV